MTTAAKFARLGATVVLLALCLILTGCGKNKKINLENFNKLKPGMTLDEVQEILGKGEQHGGDASTIAAGVGVDVHAGGGSVGAQVLEYVWEAGDKTIIGHFKSGKALDFQKQGF
jgi:hypothetical protein